MILKIFYNKLSKISFCLKETVEVIPIDPTLKKRAMSNPQRYHLILCGSKCRLLARKVFSIVSSARNAKVTLIEVTIEQKTHIQKRNVCNCIAH